MVGVYIVTSKYTSIPFDLAGADVQFQIHYTLISLSSTRLDFIKPNVARYNYSSYVPLLILTA